MKFTFTFKGTKYKINKTLSWDDYDECEKVPHKIQFFGNLDSLKEDIDFGDLTPKEVRDIYYIIEEPLDKNDPQIVGLG